MHFKLYGAGICHQRRHPRSYLCVVWLLFTLTSRIVFSESVPNKKVKSKYDFVRVDVPAYVEEGDTAVLKCLYDVDPDKLYSMKFYRGATEFFRFTPQESPPIKTFPAFGGHVDLSLSNSSDVTLVHIGLNMTDEYTCEVTKDFPDYTTSIMSAKMTVIALPENIPVMEPVRQFATIGDNILVNCTSFRSKPIANITWLLNGFPVSPHYLTQRTLAQHGDGKETITVGLNFTVRQQHFIRSRMTLSCQAKIEPGLYSGSNEIIILEDDHPKISPSVVGNYSSIPSPSEAGLLRTSILVQNVMLLFVLFSFSPIPTFHT